MTQIIGTVLFAAAVSLAAQPAAASDFVILESNVSSIVPGSVIPASQSVSLSGGQKLVMIAADGSTRSVNGPYSGALGKAGSDAPGALERLTAERNDSSHVVGAIRAPSWDQE
ncbi:hypothetical protein P2H44_11150 [Albimonas sp. CAU 1670]|uniref:hypothetical protein n=1 Tax=Albimonas sp. CAU 1670 TaxID=3032599 RepID=UPI0023DA79C2|nr:hypothetical protein [Albimonas sp. CAU 1670]MDF2233109.1 hypothetical protein [Albimonas sp. CAU 1670]